MFLPFLLDFSVVRFRHPCDVDVVKCDMSQDAGRCIVHELELLAELNSNNVLTSCSCEEEPSLFLDLVARHHDIDIPKIDS